MRILCNDMLSFLHFPDNDVGLGESRGNAMRSRKLSGRLETAEYITFLLAITVFALIVRLKFLPFECDDYHQFLHPWFTRMQQGGGFAAIGMDIGDYMPPYFYLLALLTYLPWRDLYLIKCLSFAGDIVLAFYAMRLVRRRYGDFRAGIAYAVVLFLPSAVLNSAVWGQCDCIYTAALLACVCYVEEKRDWAAAVAFSIAFVFKLQAVFLAPFLLLLCLRKRIRWRCVFVLPAVYLAAILPAVMAGRNLGNLLTVYFRQAREYAMISMNLPNLAVWYPSDTSVPVGHTIAAAAAVLTLAGVIWLWKRGPALDDGTIFSLALLSVLFVPYFLPYMHERYFYPADIFSAVYAFYYPGKFYISVVTSFCSVCVVCHYLFNTQFMDVRILSVLMFFCLLSVALSTVIPHPEKRDMKRQAGKVY